MPIPFRTGYQPRRSDYEAIDDEDIPSGCCMCWPLKDSCWSKYFGCLGNLHCFRRAEILEPEAIHPPEPTTQQPISQPPIRQQSLSLSPTLQEPLLTSSARQRPPLQPPPRQEQISEPPTGQQPQSETRQQPPLESSNREQQLPELTRQETTLRDQIRESLSRNKSILQQTLDIPTTGRFSFSYREPVPQQLIPEANPSEILLGRDFRSRTLLRHELLSEPSAESRSRGEASVLGERFRDVEALARRESMNRGMPPIHQQPFPESMQDLFGQGLRFPLQLQEPSRQYSQMVSPWDPSAQYGFDGTNWEGLNRRESQTVYLSERRILPEDLREALYRLQPSSDTSLSISFTRRGTQQDDRSRWVSPWEPSRQDMLNNYNREEMTRRESLRQPLRQPFSESPIRQESRYRREPKREPLRKSPPESSIGQDAMRESVAQAVESRFGKNVAELNNPATLCHPANKLPNRKEFRYDPPVRQEPLSESLTRPVPIRNSTLSKRISEWLQESFTRRKPLARKEPMEDSKTQERSLSDPLIQDGFSDLRRILTQQEPISDYTNQRELQQDTPIRQMSLPEPLNIPHHPSWGSTFRRENLIPHERLTRSLQELSSLRGLPR